MYEVNPNDMSLEKQYLAYINNTGRKEFPWLSTKGATYIEDINK